MKTANVPIISRRILTKKPLILSGSVTLHISKQSANGTISALQWTFFPAKSSPEISRENQMLIWSWLRSKKLIQNETHHWVLCFILTVERNILHLHSGSYWIVWMLYSHFPRKDILSIMPAVNVSSSTLKKKKLTVKHIIPWRNSSYQCSNTWKDSIMSRDHMVFSEWWPQMKKKNGTGHSSTRHFFFINCVHFIDYSPLAFLSNIINPLLLLRTFIHCATYT